ncbi:MAG: MBL fold metallo-hydrolase [Acidobacteria bacterium]|nr:MBL fold metallo-hydrolase [Acidobacteriota bacterium]
MLTENSSRRHFMRIASGCAGYLATAPLWVRQSFAIRPQATVVAETPFARIEALADGVWGVISTPLRDGERQFATTSNGGIVQGRDGLLIVEGFMSDEGSAWVAEQAFALTGMRPTHVVLTHFHGDHCRGIAGLGLDGAASHATARTRELMAEGEETILPEGEIAANGDTTIDLGGTQATVTARMGHTPSDVTVEIRDRNIVFCGDLVWNEMFPNFTHSIPSHMVRACEQLLRRDGVTYVPGHGDVADMAAQDNYLGLLQDLERAAQRDAAAGVDLAAAVAAYEVPASLGTFVQFGADYVERAFRAWYRELGAAV